MRWIINFSLQWRHNGHDGVSNHQPHSTVYSGADQRKRQSSVSLAFWRGIHRGPHKWPVTRKMFPFDDVIMCLLFCIFWITCCASRSYQMYDKLVWWLLEYAYLSYDHHQIISHVTRPWWPWSIVHWYEPPLLTKPISYMMLYRKSMALGFWFSLRLISSYWN